VVVNNSANINKMNNYLSAQIIENTERLQHLVLEIWILLWDRHKDVVALNWG
jgi:hypothetical protein